MNDSTDPTSVQRSRSSLSTFQHAALVMAMALGAFLLTVHFFCPRFSYWKGLHIGVAQFTAEVHRAVDVLRQVQDPFVTIENPVNRVIQWRLLFPLLAHYTNMPTWLFLALPHIGCLLLLAYVARLVLRHSGSARPAFLATVLMAAAPWFFVATGWLTYNDSWYLLGLVLVTFSRSRVAVALSCLLAPFIDERFVLNLPLAFTLRVIWLELLSRERSRRLVYDLLAVGLPSLAYVGIRLFLLLGRDQMTGSYIQDHLGYLGSAPWYRYVEGLWMGLRAGWMLVIALVWVLHRLNRDAEIRVLLVALVFTIAVSLFVAADVARSSSSMLPAALLGLLLLMRHRPDWVRRGLPIIVVLNLLLPASHIILHFRQPILNFYAELERANNPPPFLDPKHYYEAGMTFRLTGRYNDSQDALTVGIQLAPRYLEAYAQRALAYVALNDLPRATADAETALSINRVSPDALYARGAAYLKAGDLTQAIEFLQQALYRSPMDWPLRVECTEHLRDAKLASTQPSRI